VSDKVKLSLDVWESATSALDGGVINFTLRPLYSRGRSRKGQKKLCPFRESNPVRPARSLAPVLTELLKLPKFQQIKFNWWVKVKVKLSLCLTNHHTMKTYWVSGAIAPRIL
jgi:hypothetical protein